MKKLLLFLILIPSLHAIGGSVPISQGRTTVMIYMNAKNELDCDAIADLHEMVKALPLSHITVVVELGRHPFKRCADEDSSNVWSGVLFFEITKDLTPAPWQALRNVPQKPASWDTGADVNMGDPQSLRKFVVWAERSKPAEHYILVIWGHGHGFRLMDAVLRAKQSAQPPPNGNGYRAVSFDDDYHSYLFTHDFQEALEGTPKLDVLAFDSCLMAGIETAYAVRKLSYVMVGSEELEDKAGWDYTKVLRRLSRNTKRTPYTFGSSIVKAIQANAKATNNPVTVSAIDLSKAAAISNRISHLADVLMAELAQEDHFQEIQSKISAVRRKSCNYGRVDGFHNPIDLLHFVELLRDNPPTLNISKATRLLLDDFIRTKIVFDDYATEKMRRKFGSNGLSIYFPGDKQWYNNDPDDHGEGYSKCICGIASKHPVDFVCWQNWSAFLRVYFLPEDTKMRIASQTSN
jgi:cysteine peptidase C11 family protein